MPVESDFDSPLFRTIPSLFDFTNNSYAMPGVLLDPCTDTMTCDWYPTHRTATTDSRSIINQPFRSNFHEPHRRCRLRFQSMSSWSRSGGIAALVLRPSTTPAVQNCTNGCYSWSPRVRVYTDPLSICMPGYAWRGANDSDHVCVTPQTYIETQYDNSQTSYRVDPNGPYRPDTCLQGFVWREACVG